MSLNNSQMLPARSRDMRQMKDVLNAEDIILAEIERMIDEMYQRASLLHEELINEEWLENKLTEKTGAEADVTGYAQKLLAEIILNVSELQHIDLPDVRKFLNKWMPAHLMYKIIFLINYSVEIEEIFSFEIINMGATIPFWKNHLLNGDWFLDGSVLLDSQRQYELTLQLWNTWIISLKETVRSFFVRATYHTEIREIISGFSKKLYLSINEPNGEVELSMKLHYCVESVNERIGEEKVTLRRNLWYLNGNVLMNGLRVLNAMEREENI